MQRFFDILFSGLALILFAPLLLPLMIILRVTGEGEVFYLQKRVGKGGKTFKLYKFATMLRDSPNIGTGTITLRDDPRVLPMGKILRKTKINELPQLLNIFFGQMSVVGPRPQTPRCFDAFTVNQQELIKRVKPGLSGIGSIIFRDEQHILGDQTNSINLYDQVIAPYKGEVEAWYIDNQSLRIYLVVIFVTAWVVISPNSGIVWTMFRGLPEPPDELKAALNYPAGGVKLASSRPPASIEPVPGFRVNRSYEPEC